MCGIIGAVALSDPAPLDASRLDALRDALAHRGPDDADSLAGDGFWLGHRRLSIIDPSAAARQPMSDPSGRVHITYNGEVFNHVALRERLAADGYGFRSRSDTEVVLAAYCARGLRSLRDLRGMFAFGLVDERSGSFHLVRDRVGIKPVHYAVVDGWLVFCSELKGILGFPGFVRELNPIAVSAFLSYRRPLGRDTFFHGAYALEPGHLLTVRDGEISVSRWWEPPAPQSRWRPVPRPRRVRAVVRDSVRHAMVADVPVGAFLSGGLDSSAMVSEMAGAAGPVEVFTAAVPHPRFDEAPAARRVAAALGARSTTVAVSAADHVELIRELIRVKDEPLAMHNEVAVHILARQAAGRVRVVLSGEGADEVFSGYGRIFRTPFDRRRLLFAQRLPGPVRRRLERRWGEADAGRSDFDFFLRRYTYFPEEEKLGLFSGAMRRAVMDDGPNRAQLERAFEAAPRASFHDRIARFFLTVHLPGLLHMMDAMTMAASVELRVPYLDNALLERAFPLPRRAKLRWRSPVHRLIALGQPTARYSERADVTKRALRRAYRRRLPKEVLTRPKGVFGVPLGDWFAGELEGLLRESLLAPDAYSAALFDQARLGDWLERHADDPRFGRKAWLLLNLELWLREAFPDGAPRIHDEAAALHEP